MNKQQLQQVRHEFLAYTNRFIEHTNGVMAPMMELKREHCAFVAKNCHDLVVAEGWDQAQQRSAEALGLLHDIGRFSQLEEFETFSDSLSINHGFRGAEIIEEEGILDGLDSEQKVNLVTAVKYHNAHQLPTHLPEEQLHWLKLIRDADRLDIYRVVLNAIQTKQLNNHPEIGLKLSLDGDPCPELMDKIMQLDPPEYRECKSFSDFLLLILSWCYQMSYSSTLDLIRKRGIIDALAEYLPKNHPRVGSVLSLMRKRVIEI